MQFRALALALLMEHVFSQGMFEMMRFSCSQLVVERLDPLVSPGSIASPHLHQIVGGNSFNATMDPETHDLSKLSTCTSCTFTEDLSNYWTAVLYFRARNGTYKRVPQFVSEGLKADGGITVYYIPSPNRSESVTAFKPGFRMLVGDATLQGPSKDPKVCHRCMPKTGEMQNLNCAPPDTQALPKGFCAGGIRSVITFPTCWDGVNTDSPNHQSHIAYPAHDTSVGSSGTCPETHPVKIPQVMLEVMWDVSTTRAPCHGSYGSAACAQTRLFNDPDLWPEDGSQPFFWSTNDPHGFTQHGDYVFGWEGDALQRAMDARCNADVCDVLKTQSSEEAMNCTIPRLVQEEIDGWLTDIPGIVPLS